jgi:dihydroorotate dehydrogenase electron transfer subunit
MLLRRAFSIHDVRPDHGGTVEFVFAPVGPGTRWLAERRTRDVLDLAGPLGRPFPVPRDPVSCLLVGGGYGSAPLFPLAARLRSRDCQVDFLLGAASADRVFGALTARRTGRTAAITTEDGSMGIRGLVTDRLTQVIHEARTDVIYACGPMGMLRQVTALAQRYEIPVLTLVEETMACGIGVCMTCVLPVVGDDGVTRMVRSCVAGPVFRGDTVRWDDIGTIPFDALGAPGWNPRPHAAAARSAAGRSAPGRPAPGRPAPGRPAAEGTTSTSSTANPNGPTRTANPSSTAGTSSSGTYTRHPRNSTNPTSTANPTSTVSGAASGPGAARKERHGG